MVGGEKREVNSAHNAHPFYARDFPFAPRKKDATARRAKQTRVRFRLKCQPALPSAPRRQPGSNSQILRTVVMIGSARAATVVAASIKPLLKRRWRSPPARLQSA
jgi:hypothetical protein